MIKLLSRKPTALRLVNPSAAKDRKSGSAGMPRPISYAVFCLKKKNCRPILVVGRARPGDRLTSIADERDRLGLGAPARIQRDATHETRRHDCLPTGTHHHNNNV